MIELRFHTRPREDMVVYYIFLKNSNLIYKSKRLTNFSKKNSADKRLIKIMEWVYYYQW